MAWVLAVTLAAGGGLYLLLARRGRADERRLQADLALAVERGTLADLGRGQALGRRLVLSHGADRDTAAALAFADAMLAVDYGAETADEAARALAGAGLGADAADSADDGPARDGRRGPGADPAARRRPGRGGARGGRRRSRAPRSCPTPFTRWRGPARAPAIWPGAERALDAAIVEAPAFAPARVAWAEGRLDSGDSKSAETGLAPLLGRAPADPRALLLLDQIDAALGQPAPAGLDDALPADATGAAAGRRRVRAVAGDPGAARGRSRRRARAGRRSRAAPPPTSRGCWPAPRWCWPSWARSTSPRGWSSGRAAWPRPRCRCWPGRGRRSRSARGARPPRATMRARPIPKPGCWSRGWRWPAAASRRWTPR